MNFSLIQSAIWHAYGLPTGDGVHSSVLALLRHSYEPLRPLPFEEEGEKMSAYVPLRQMFLHPDTAKWFIEECNRRGRRGA